MSEFTFLPSFLAMNVDGSNRKPNVNCKQTQNEAISTLHKQIKPDILTLTEFTYSFSNDLVKSFSPDGFDVVKSKLNNRANDTTLLCWNTEHLQSETDYVVSHAGKYISTILNIDPKGDDVDQHDKDCKLLICGVHLPKRSKPKQLVSYDLLNKHIDEMKEKVNVVIVNGDFNITYDKIKEEFSLHTMIDTNTTCDKHRHGIDNIAFSEVDFFTKYTGSVIPTDTYSHNPVFATF
jgi:exonuclease III